jgi:hypothetical protein
VQTLSRLNAAELRSDRTGLCLTNRNTGNIPSSALSLLTKHKLLSKSIIIFGCLVRSIEETTSHFGLGCGGDQYVDHRTKFSLAFAVDEIVSYVGECLTASCATLEPQTKDSISRGRSAWKTGYHVYQEMRGIFGTIITCQGF